MASCSSLTFRTRANKVHFWASLMISLSVFMGTPHVGPSLFTPSTETFGDETIDTSSRMGQRLVHFTSLFEPSQRCVKALYNNGTQITAVCNCSSIADVPPGLSFTNVPTVLSGVAPFVADVLVSSPGSGCGDILEALFLGTDLLAREVVFLGQVEALGNDSYRVRGNLHSPGSYELKVHTIWKDFSPFSSCQSCRHCLQEEPWGAMSTNQISLPILVRPGIAPYNNAQRPATMELVQEATVQTKRPPCETMDELLDGVWVWNASLPQETAFANVNEMLRKGVPDPEMAKVLKPLNSTWSPNTCTLTAYNATYLQTLFRGKHLHFVGDSTMQEVLRLLLIFFDATPPEYPTTPGCTGYPDRQFDSGTTHTVRFSFAWVGGPNLCHNGRGIKTLIAGGGKQQFVDRYQKDADFVMVNAGLHDVARGGRVGAYMKALPAFFDILVDEARNANSRERFIWLSSNPKTHTRGKCPPIPEDDESNGSLLWMNHLAGSLARTNYSFTVMDSYRIVKAANLVSVPQGGKEQCGDGHHCIGCDSCWAKALVLVHYMVTLLTRAPMHSA